MEPDGRMPDFTTSSTIRCASHAVGEAGFTSTGTPERNAGAAFSQKPHAGKLKALMKSATPFAGERKCCAPKTSIFVEDGCFRAKENASSRKHASSTKIALSLPSTYHLWRGRGHASRT